MQPLIQRRDFLKLAGLAAVGVPLAAQQLPVPPEISGAEFNLEIGPVTVELAPNRILSTIGYNGTSPGPLLRMKEGKQISVDVINETDTPELVHWHGLLIPPDMDGVEEQGTPFVPGSSNGKPGQRRYTFTPGPSGSRWYHSHAMAFSDLHKGSY